MRKSYMLTEDDVKGLVLEGFQSGFYTGMNFPQITANYSCRRAAQLDLENRVVRILRGKEIREGTASKEEHHG